MTNIDDLPGILKDIAEVAGVEAAFAVARAKGGVSVYFPAKSTVEAGRGQWLVDAVGRDAALKIADALGSVSARIMVPLGPERRVELERRVQECLDKGLSIADTARKLGVHSRTVEKVRAKLAKAARQNGAARAPNSTQKRVVARPDSRW